MEKFQSITSDKYEQVIIQNIALFKNCAEESYGNHLTSNKFKKKGDFALTISEIENLETFWFFIKTQIQQSKFLPDEHA